MEIIAIIVLASLLPIMSIASFIIGFNVNAQKKIFTLPKKVEVVPNEDELMLERIDKARV
jgi:hypothetical protein